MNCPNETNHKSPIDGVFITYMGHLGPEIICVTPDDSVLPMEERLITAIKAFPIAGEKGDFGVYYCKRNRPITTYLFIIPNPSHRDLVCSLSVILATESFNPLILRPICKSIIAACEKENLIITRNLSRLAIFTYEVLTSCASSNDLTAETDFASKIVAKFSSMP